VIEPVTHEWMPGRNGGQLRRGGGRGSVKQQREAITERLAKSAGKVADEVLRKALGTPRPVKCPECKHQFSAIVTVDLRAAELVLAYVLGRPSEHVELTGAEGGPMEFATYNDHERQLLTQVLDDAIRAREAAEAAGA
jgi:hypothetical protein